MPETIKLNIKNEHETKLLAQALSRLLHAGHVVALRGDLGAGKTTLARALIQALNPNEVEVPSPTFTLVQEYQGPECPILHFDLYRLSNPEEVYELGWEDARRHIILVEWPERLGSLLPQQHIDIYLKYGANPDQRLVEITGPEEITKLTPVLMESE